jgi:hypothetical protein
VIDYQRNHFVAPRWHSPNRPTDEPKSPGMIKKMNHTHPNIEPFGPIPKDAHPDIFAACNSIMPFMVLCIVKYLP